MSEPMTDKPEADEMSAHARVFEYDGAFKCRDCGAQWGALPGNPTMPAECKPPCVYSDLLPDIQRQRTLDGESKSEWFKKGQASVRRRNESGCCCDLGDDGETVTSLCMLHDEWVKRARAEALEEAAKMCDEQMFLGLPPPDYRKGWHAATRRCAAAIRNLAPGSSQDNAQANVSK